jgi:hypothetical protein
MMSAVKASGITKSPLFGSRACAAMTDSSSEGIVYGCEYRLHREGRSRNLKGLQPKFGVCRHCGIEQDGDPRYLRRNLLE